MANRGLNDEWPIDQPWEIPAGETDIFTKATLLGRPNGYFDLDDYGDIQPIWSGVDPGKDIDDCFGLDANDDIQAVN